MRRMGDISDKVIPHETKLEALKIELLLAFRDELKVEANAKEFRKVMAELNADAARQRAQQVETMRREAQAALKEADQPAP